MAAARACLVALAVAAALFLEGGAAAAGAGNAGAASMRQRRRQLLRQRQVRSHLKRLNKAPLATIEVHTYLAANPSFHSPPSSLSAARRARPVRSTRFPFRCHEFRLVPFGLWD
jgi:hypothetical protein